MTQRIIYQNTDGSVAIIVPSQEAISSYGIDAIAQKDVPAGLSYKIVDVADVPTDRTFRSAWTVDTESVTDGVGAESNTFEEITQ